MILTVKWVVLSAIFLHALYPGYCQEYTVQLNNNKTVLTGESIRFVATLYCGNKTAVGQFAYYWEDNAIPSHCQEILTDKPIVTWNVEYDDKYPPGFYEVQVIVKKKFFKYYAITSGRSEFILLSRDKKKD